MRCVAYFAFSHPGSSLFVVCLFWKSEYVFSSGDSTESFASYPHQVSLHALMLCCQK